jgi:hypothetical protein
VEDEEEDITSDEKLTLLLRERNLAIEDLPEIACFNC